MRNWKTWSMSLIRFHIRNIIVSSSWLPNNHTQTSLLSIQRGQFLIFIWGWYHIIWGIAGLLWPSNNVRLLQQFIPPWKAVVFGCEYSGWWWRHQFQRVCLVDDQVKSPFPASSQIPLKSKFLTCAQENPDLIFQGVQRLWHRGRSPWGVPGFWQGGKWIYNNDWFSRGFVLTSVDKLGQC